MNNVIQLHRKKVNPLRVRKHACSPTSEVYVKGYPGRRTSGRGRQEWDGLVHWKLRLQVQNADGTHSDSVTLGISFCPWCGVELSKNGGNKAS